MKIGVLTFHRAYNYGAFLQCYSLQKELSTRFPEAEISVIDYESQNMANYYKTNWLTYFFGQKNSLIKHPILRSMKTLVGRTLAMLKGNSQIKEFFSNNKLIKNFEKCYEYLPLTASRLVSDDYEKSIAFINSLKFDIVIVGSDAIWNDYQTNIPNVYYLSEKIESRKMSYAASSYGMAYKDVLSTSKSVIENSLKSYEFIGVRDDETYTYVKSISPNLVLNHTCDPSLFLNLNKLPISVEEVINKLNNLGVDTSKPIIGVMGNSYIGKMARDVCGDEYTFVSIYYENKYCDYSLVDLTPFEWALVFSQFKATFTSFFHGTIFSLKNGTPVFTIEQNIEYSQSYKTKTRDILERMDLSDYYFNADRQDIELIKKQFEKIKECDQAQRIYDALKKEKITSEPFFEKLSALVGR